MSEVTQALAKLESFDADLRYMGLNDLKAIFEGPQRHTLVSDHYRVLQQVKDEVVKHLADPITEVQTQAVKTLGPLVQLLPDHEVISILGSIATQKASTVLTLALRTIIGNSVPGERIAQVIVNLIMDRDADPDYKTSIEDCEVVNDLIRRFGPYLSASSIDRLLDHIMARVSSPQSSVGNLVRRRSFVALGLLAPYESEGQWDAQRQFIASTLEPPSAEINGVQLVIKLCDTAPGRVTSIPNVVERIYALANAEEVDDTNVELVEHALAAVEALYLAGDIAATKVVSLAQKYLSFHPNYVEDDGGDDDVGSEFELSEDEEAYDDDLSWKLRRYAVRLTQELATHDEAHAATLVPALVGLLRVESEQGVRELAVDTLSGFTSVPVLYAACQPHIGTFIEMAQKDTTGVYLSLLRALLSHPLPTPQIEQIVVVAASQSKRATLPATLSLVQALAPHVRPDPRLLPPVAQGLADVEFQTVSLALDAALALGSAELVEAVCTAGIKAQNLSIQGQALKVAAAIVDDSHAEVVLAHILQALQTADLQIPAIHASKELLERCELSDAAIDEASQHLVQLLASSQLRAVAIALLRALRVIAARVPQLASQIFAAAQTHDVWEPAVVGHKCRLFAEIPTTPGVREFAVTAAQRLNEDVVNTQPAVINLWGSLAASDDAEGLLREAEVAAEEAGRTPLWAQIIAEVAVKGHLPIDTEFSEFGVHLVAALAERGRCAASLESLAQAAAPTPSGGESVSPVIVGQAIAELAIAGDQKEKLYEAAAMAQDSAAAEMFIAALEVILQREPTLDVVAAARRLIELVPLADLKIVGRLLGQAVVSLPGGVEQLDGWPVLCQIYGAKHAYKTASPAMQPSLETVFLRLAEHGDLVVRENALEALSWALQQSSISAQQTQHADVWGVLLRATYVDKSLVETIQVGPFKHTVDHGLAARKAAYEALYALASYRAIDTVRNHGEPLVAALVRGLRDEHDVKMLSLYTLETLAAVPAAARLFADAKPLLLEAFAEIETAKVRETSVKQEHDRQAEALQTLATVRKALGF